MRTAIFAISFNMMAVLAFFSIVGPFPWVARRNVVRIAESIRNHPEAWQRREAFSDIAVYTQVPTERFNPAIYIDGFYGIIDNANGRGEIVLSLREIFIFRRAVKHLPFKQVDKELLFYRESGWEVQ